VPVLGNPLDDSRAAAQLKVTRALYLFTIGLATVAGASALVTFFLGSFHHLGWFFGTVVLAFICAFVSIERGGQGIKDIYIAGYDRDWKENTGKRKLSIQAIFVMLAALLIAVAALVGHLTAHRNSDPLQAAISAQATATAKLATEVATTTHTNIKLITNDVQTLSVSVRNLESQVIALTVHCRRRHRHESRWRGE
jgi:hypothetical protein